MKKICCIAFFACQLLQAQDSVPNTIALRHNEVRVDLLSLVGYSKYNLSYERFFNNKFSVGMTVNYANSNKVNDDFQSGNRNTIPKFEIIPHLRYRLSESRLRYYFLEAFIAANGGDFREIVRQADGANAFYSIQESNYFDMAIGGSAGYKMYFKEKWALELLVGFGTNTLDKEKSPDVFSRVGLSFGYRF